METGLKKYWDTVTMAKRCVLLSARNPDTLLTSVIMPVMMMVLFVALFGKLIRVENMSYVDYIIPGVLMQCFGQCSSVTAITVNRDVTGGMARRFSVLPVKTSSVLLGYTTEAFFRNMLTAFVVLTVSLFFGFSPKAAPGDWCIILLLLSGVIFAFSWIAVFVGIKAGSPEGASSFLILVIVLPYLSSGFVPVEAMPKALAFFAEHQPMTPVINTVRNAILGNTWEIRDFVAAILWCVGFCGVFYGMSVRELKKKNQLPN